MSDALSKMTSSQHPDGHELRRGPVRASGLATRQGWIDARLCGDDGICADVIRCPPPHPARRADLSPRGEAKSERIDIDDGDFPLSPWGEGRGEGAVFETAAKDHPLIRPSATFSPWGEGSAHFPLSPWGEGEVRGRAVMRSGAVGLARDLRKHETKAEHILWSRLRNRQLDGWKFKRQVPFGRFIIDFYCSDARLAVEVDGGTHATPGEIASDSDRTKFLETNGVRVLRCWNSDIRGNVEGVLEMIYLAIDHKPAPSPGATRRPLPKGRGEVGAH